MKVLILGLNYAPEPVGIGPYTAGMATTLAEAGCEVVVIAGKPYYPFWKIDSAFARASYIETSEDGVAVVRCPIYVPANPSGTKRLLHHASFALAALPMLLIRALRMRPDVIIAVAPSLISAPAAWLAARLSGARYWLHIQDFEVEAAFATGLLKERGIAAWLARRFETASLRAAGRVSTISPQMCIRLIEKGVERERIVEFRNWASIDQVVPLQLPSTYRSEWGIVRPHVVLYSGNIANKQGIEIVIETARLLQRRDDLLFAICGNGANRERLIEAAEGLDNIRFYDLQPSERLSEVLGLASVHLLPQIASAADLVLPSKLTNMLASGRPVVATAGKGTGLAGEVEGCGLIVEPGNASAFAAAIEQLIDDPQARVQFGAAARTRAEERWSKKKILSGFNAALARFIEHGA
jgi:colanic acid biosynthesis glycosyl transferase WcaI